MRSNYLGRLFASFYLALASYCLLSAIAGPAGIIAYRGLAGKLDSMKANLEALGTTNTALQSELDALRNDPDRAGREARALGYLQPEEMALIVQSDNSGRGQQRLEPGSVVRASSAVPLSDSVIKEIALLIGIATLILGLASDLIAGPASRRGQAQPINRGW